MRTIRGTACFLESQFCIRQTCGPYLEEEHIQLNSGRIRVFCTSVLYLCRQKRCKLLVMCQTRSLYWRRLNQFWQTVVNTGVSTPLHTASTTLPLGQVHCQGPSPLPYLMGPRMKQPPPG